MCRWLVFLAISWSYFFFMWLYSSACAEAFLKTPKHQLALIIQSTMKVHCKSFGGRAVNDSQNPSMWHLALKRFPSTCFYWTLNLIKGSHESGHKPGPSKAEPQAHQVLCYDNTCVDAKTRETPPQKKERERKWRKRKNVCGGYDVRLDYWILCILISKVRSSSNP